MKEAMKEQLIITVGREFGSGGHPIAEALSKHYQIPLFDKEFFFNGSKDHDLPEMSAIGDDQAVFPVLMHTGSYLNNSLMQQQFGVKKEFTFIREKAEAGESFVIVGRCAEDVLRDHPACISLFILADEAFKLQRVMEELDLDEKQALSRMRREDKTRKAYHNFYSRIKWGDSRGYDLCINSAKMGIPHTVQFLVDYIDEFRARRKEEA